MFSSTSPRTVQAPVTSPTSTSSQRDSPSSELSIISWTPFTDSETLLEDDSPYYSESSSSLVPPQRAYPSTIPPSLLSPSAWQSVGILLPPPLRSILSHYEYTTSLTLTTSDPAKTAWQTYLPEIASNHDFLVNCVLSVASLHLGRLHDRKDEKRRMNAIAAARMNKALTRYRSELSNVTQRNAAALFASAMLTAVYLFRTASIDIEDLRSSIPPGTDVPPADTVDKIMACALRPIWGLRGPLTVLMSGWSWVLGGRMHPVAARKWWPRECIPATARAVEEDELLRQLEDSWINWGPERVHLSQALSILRESFALVSQLTLPETYPPPALKAWGSAIVADHNPHYSCSRTAMPLGFSSNSRILDPRALFIARSSATVCWCNSKSRRLRTHCPS